jgi:benzoyl-CoA reductase/2-hydroxyglutaryl-CoA dehydratase subunit BcrC/BadD/HgdB
MDNKDMTAGGFKGERSKKQLQSSRTVNEYNKNHYQKVVERAKQGEPYIWTNVGVPMEIMFAMDIPILFNLNWSALISAKQMGERYLNVLNRRGYFRDLCRYCSLPLGYFFDNKPEEGPWGGLPKPAAVVVEAADNPIVRIYELMARELNVPLYIYDHTMPAEPPDESWGQNVETMEEESYKESWRVDYAEKETESLIGFLENLTGKTLSEAGLREVMKRSNEQFQLIGKVLDLTKATPCPMSMGDHIANLISTQFYRGHEFGLFQAKLLYEEVNERVENKIAAYKNERIRLMHLGVPNWFTPGFYDSFEEKYGAVFVWMGYLPVTQQLIRSDLRDPVRALASRYVGYTEMGLLPPWFILWFLNYAREFKIDGVVYQNAESCRLLSGPKRLFFEALKREGIPYVELESDYVDVRDWDDAKMKAQMAGFVETLL